MNSDQIKIRGCRRPKRKLTLTQQTEVIKAYKYLQNYLKVARLFDCSTMVIKGIITRQDELLEHYESFRAQNINNCAEPNSHEEKMNFLGKVVFEYLLRAMNFRMPIDTTVIRQKALEVKEALGIEDFTPDEQWLHDFKVNSNRLDLVDLMEKLENNIENQRSLDCNDLIEYVREQNREERRKLKAEDERIARLSPTFEKLSKEKKKSFRNKNCDNVGKTSATVSKRKTVVVGKKGKRKTRVKLKAAAKGSVKDCNIIESIREQDRDERRELNAEDEHIARLSPTFEKLSKERFQAEKEESFRNENSDNVGNTSATVSKRKTVVVGKKGKRKTRVKLKPAAKGSVEDCNIIEHIGEQDRDERRELNAEDEHIARLSPTFEKLSKERFQAEEEESFRNENRNARRCVQEDTEVNKKSEMEENLDIKQESESSDDNQELTSGDSKIFKIIKVESINPTVNDRTSPEIPTTISAPRAGISSYAVALHHLRKLDNFAMNQEDYEALSVITQLEFIFRNSK